MRVLFVYPGMEPYLVMGNLPPLASLTLASFIKREGHEVRLWDRGMEKQSISRMLAVFSPDVVVCTLMFTLQLADMQVVCRKIRALRPDLPILYGGVTATLFPEMILREGLVDYVGISEGEYTLKELLEVIERRREPSSVQSLVYLGADGQAVHTPLRPFAALSDFPCMDYSLLPMERYFAYFPEMPRASALYASKGCPCQCTFCFNKSYYRCRHRVRNRQSVMHEIEMLVTDYGAQGIWFIDELWGLDKRELHAYCNSIAALSQKRGQQIRWGCETRIGVLQFEDFKRMADTGCSFLSFGFESGSPEILKRIKKGYPLARVEPDINNCKAVGIRAWLNVIFGFPGETQAQIKQTIHAIFRLNPTIYATGLFYASPGTAEYNDLVAAGKITPPKDFKSWRRLIEKNFVTANYSAIPSRELKVIHFFFYWRVLFQDRKDQKTGRLEYVITALQRVLESIGQKGFFRFFFRTIRLVINAAWYAHAYPGIRKKYDLYARNFGRKDWDDLAHLDAC